ncbi:MAG: class I SAM-dependent methyltransferase [Bacteroidales bacterium]|nr:class I SAM-dependent methyltransferase [Bacteroidales bacterium]MBQ7576478.1 class I SAM-dependent methyltransferase [Bacteroidales bacterium]
MKIECPPQDWKDYELLDSGDGSKLERFGQYVMMRPEPKALWHKSMSDAQWRSAAHFEFKPGAGFAKAGKEDSGSWVNLRKAPDQWVISYPQVGIKLRLGLTAFKHVGVFPEQATNWDYIYANTREIAQQTGARPKVLNLFAYTGGASLAACRAGAEVTHLDSVKQVVTWARGNMELSGLDGIRWMVEDALKFAKRAQRRGTLYNGIILDPPAYGRGPDGERWTLEESLFDILQCCASILAPKDSFLVLNLYSNGYSAVLAETLVRCAFGPAGQLECGESVLRDKFGKALPLSVFARLKR